MDCFRYSAAEGPFCFMQMKMVMPIFSFKTYFFEKRTPMVLFQCLDHGVLGCILGAVGPQITDLFSILGNGHFFQANQVVHPKAFRRDIIF